MLYRQKERKGELDRIMKWFKNKKDRTWDFEGRCVQCSKNLNLVLTVIKTDEVKLNVQKCSEHPEDSLILWPTDRDDILVNWKGEGK